MQGNVVLLALDEVKAGSMPEEARFCRYFFFENSRTFA